MKKVTDKVKLEIIKMYKDDLLTGYEIARRLELGETTVYRHLKNAGLNPVQMFGGSKRKRSFRGKSVYKFDYQTELEIVELYKSGLTHPKIANKYDVIPGTIRKILQRHQVEFRPRSSSHWKDLEQETIDEILERFDAGESGTAISISVGCTYKNVLRVLQENDRKQYRHTASKETHGMWKGGISVVRGYIQVKLDISDKLYEMVGTNGYVFEHRLVMARYLGRPLEKWETVHHIDGDKANNDISNLQLRIGKHGSNSAYYCLDCGSKRIGPCKIG